MKNRIYKVVCTFAVLLILSSQFMTRPHAYNKDVKIATRITEVLFGKEDEERTLLVGGGIFGAKIKQSYVSIVEAKSAPKLRPGDILLSLCGTTVTNTSDVEDIMSRATGEPVEIVVRRGDSNVTTLITPTEKSGKYKLGIKLKDTATGIGTITFIDKESGVFGGLGHGVCDVETGELVGLSSGTMTGVLLGGIHKGEAGKPGELCGVLTGKVLGSIYSNSECGIFGKIDADAYSTSEFVEYKAAKPDEVHVGSAEILATVKNGSPRKYTIEITEICDGSSPSKSFKVRVTDKALIALSGGIVRGMSGSPIIQDGKLIGAVTHVMVANPTEGYGIFIENMLSAASEGVLPKVA